ncbi:SRPBCC domain-containing protein [Flagellimonas algicola]|uniref:SRPBCC domain-containing protein n=1 Tax=Flagellimonas algicola TaxID=2583815 RepID=A0ABY2WKR6_9FLAO|nr:SRPBCC domain-containing protein [Allomuricauda algicola]TMU55132.1 SRPBCC domain-containing protein [Allomuricauda algicola]
MKKSMYIAIGVIAIMLILTVTGRKSAHHEITIKASPEKVWKVLTDMNDYSNWNPVMKLLEGEVKEGNEVKYRFTQDADNISEIGATVVQITPNRLLNQKGGIPLVLTFNHKYILEPTGSSTKVTIHEDYKGIGVNFWNPKGVEEAYGKLNMALKVRVETKK